MGDVQWVLGGVVVLVAVIGLLQARRGRVQVRSCCPADPAHDLRMRAAFAEDQDPD